MPACPCLCGRTIPASKFMCNIDADRAAALVPLMSVAFETGDALKLAQLVAQLLAGGGS